MALGFGGNLALVLVFSSMFSMAIAYNRNLPDWKFPWPYHNPNATQPRKIVVGGSEKWHFGYNYTDWAIKNGPLYVGDTLVFKYDPPNATTFPHSVYLLPNFWSFLNCDVKKGKKIADVNQGGGEGFEFELKNWQPYYFACGEHDGFHCKNGTMKFPVYPLIHWKK